MNQNFLIRSMVIGACTVVNCAMTLGQVMELSHRTFKADDALVPYRIKDKWGFSDSTRNVIIPVQFDEAEMFSGSYARVAVNGKVGVVDQQGRYYIQPEFYQVEYDYDVGTYRVKRDSLSDWRYRQADGSFVATPDNSDDGFMSFGQLEELPGVEEGGEGTLVFYRNGKAGYVNKRFINDKLVTVDSIAPREYDSLYSDFDPTVLMALRRGKWGLINAQGKPLTPFIYESMGSPNFYEVFQAKKRGKWGLINKRNQVVLPFKYDKLHVDVFVRGYILYQDGRCGHFNPDTKKLIPPRYKYVDGFGFHRYCLVVTLQNKKGYIDEDGNEFFEE